MQLFPKNTDFFKYFEQMADIVKNSSQLLLKFEEKKTDANKVHKRIRKYETEADDLCHKIIDEVNINFITSIDREDIYALSGNLDNVIDYTENLAASFIVYNIPGISKKISQYLKLIDQSSELLYELVYLLKFRNKKIQQMRSLIVQINSFENKADDLIRADLISLFKKNTNPVRIIKMKDIYNHIEKLLDEYEKTALIIEEIIVKNF